MSSNARPGRRTPWFSTASSAPGLAFASRKAGGRPSYLAQYTLAGSKRRIPLGSCCSDFARGGTEAVQAILGDVAKGRDPAAERKQTAREAKEKAEADALTLGALLDQWEAGHLAGRRPGVRQRQRPRRASLRLPEASGRRRRRASRLRLSRRYSMPLSTTARRRRRGLTGAYGRACYGWAISKDLLAENPFAGIKLSAVASRERVLSENELKAIWGATEISRAYNAIVRMSILTGQRREELPA